MFLKRSLSKSALMVSLAVLLSAAPASAVTIWTDWTSATDGAPGSASGVLNGVGVSYTGELDNHIINGTSPIWAPDSSFIGGTVTASPSTVKDDLRLNGSFPITFNGVNAITFASPLVNPVFAIWSLGAPSIAASFIFDATPTLEAGGSNSQFGGSSIVVNGNTVSGNEGNGVVQFTGTFSSISWTNTPENFYAFAVGVNGPSGPGAVPEPATLLLLGTGVAGIYALRRRRQS